MEGVIYSKIVESSLETLASYLENQKRVVESTDSLSEYNGGWGGILLREGEVEREIMQMYIGFSDYRALSRRKKDYRPAQTAAQELEYLAELVQLRIPNIRPDNPNLLLLYIRVTPLDGEAVDKIMLANGYSKFVPDESYKGRLEQRYIDPEDVMNGKWNFSQLVELLKA